MGKGKMKTHSGAKKRFKQTGTGRLMRRKANRNHILREEEPARKRRLREDIEVYKGDDHRVRKQLGISTARPPKFLRASGRPSSPIDAVTAPRPPTDTNRTTPRSKPWHE